MTKLKIAIDGPAGAGKSTVANIVAKNLGYVYIDTGAMYRAITLAVMQNKINASDIEAVAALVENCHLEIKLSPDGSNKIYLDGHDVTNAIRQQSVNNTVADIAGQRAVREVLVNKQRQMAAAGGFVLDGRDIGTVVLPDADLKIYLIASLAVRANRRYLELKDKENISLAELTKTIANRDDKDAKNAYGPMRAADDAITLDTDLLTIDQVANKIVDLAKAKIAQSDK